MTERSSDDEAARWSHSWCLNGSERYRENKNISLEKSGSEGIERLGDGSLGRRSAGAGILRSQGWSLKGLSFN
jgi:hypothetical protein